MKIYNCLIVDDEAIAREIIERYTQKIPYLNVVGNCDNAIDAMQILQNQSIDILFLDIEMSNLNGLELLRLLPNRPATILTTAYSEFALEGFELGVADYLLKPIEFERFFKAVSKVTVGHKVEVSPTLLPTENSEDRSFFVKANNKISRIEKNNILYIEALQKYIRIHTTEGNIVTLLSLSKILETLSSEQFPRIHRSFAVNIDQIDHIEGNMVRIGEHTIPISKGQKEGFITLIKNRGFLNGE